MSETYNQVSATEKYNPASHEYINSKPETTTESRPAIDSSKPEQDTDKLRHELEKTVQHEAQPSQIEFSELVGQQHTEASPDLTVPIDKTVQQQALFRILNNVRHHLPVTQRLLSKFIHQPTVDTLSEIGSKTAARPSGILGGGICAFTGSLVFVYYAKHVGFRYNYALFFILFVGGFCVGLIVEFFIRLIWRRHIQPQ